MIGRRAVRQEPQTNAKTSRRLSLVPNRRPPQPLVAEAQVRTLPAPPAVLQLIDRSCMEPADQGHRSKESAPLPPPPPPYPHAYSELVFHNYAPGDGAIQDLGLVVPPSNRRAPPPPPPPTRPVPAPSSSPSILPPMPPAIRRVITICMCTDNPEPPKERTGGSAGRSGSNRPSIDPSTVPNGKGDRKWEERRDRQGGPKRGLNVFPAGGNNR